MGRKKCLGMGQLDFVRFVKSTEDTGDTLNTKGGRGKGLLGTKIGSKIGIGGKCVSAPSCCSCCCSVAAVPCFKGLKKLYLSLPPSFSLLRRVWVHLLPME